MSSLRLDWMKRRGRRRATRETVLADLHLYLESILRSRFLLDGGQGDCFFGDLHGLRRPSSFGIGGGKRAEVARLLAIGKLHRPLSQFYRLGAVAKLAIGTPRQHPSKVVEDFGLIGGKPHRLVQMFDYFLRFAYLDQRHGQVVVRDGHVGIEPYGLSEVARRLRAADCD